MKLKIVSFNVWGLNAPASIPTLKHYLDSIPTIDVLLLQEIKLRNVACNKLKTSLWQQAASWVVEASPEYGNGDSARRVEKVGIVTFIAPQYTNCVTRTSLVMTNRAHWITL